MALETHPTTKMRWTLDKYFAWARPDDGGLYELLDGELLISPAPTVRHQTVVFNIALLLRQFAKAHKLGTVYISPIDVVLGDDLVEPDVLFVSAENKKIVGKNRITGSPDLVVEVLSLSTSRRDLRYKWDLYATHGIQEYWVVNPDLETVEVLRLEDGKYVSHCIATNEHPIHSHLLPNFSAPTSEVFDEA